MASLARRFFFYMVNPYVTIFNMVAPRRSGPAKKPGSYFRALKDSENFRVHDGVSFLPIIRKLDVDPLVLNAGKKRWTSFALRTPSYAHGIVQPGDRAAFRDKDGVQRLYLIYDHRFLLDTMQPLPLLRAIKLSDDPYTGGFGLQGRYKSDYSNELHDSAKAKMPALKP